MRILVNEKELDVTLQNEKTVGDIFGQVERWLADSGMSISRIEMDDDDVSGVAREQWESKPLDDVQQIQLEAALPADRDPQSLITLIEYFELLARNLEERSQSALRDVLGEFPYIRGSADRVLRLTGSSGALLGPIEELVETVDHAEDAGQLSESVCEHALKQTNSVISHLQSRLSEILRPEQELRVTASLLSEQLPGVSEVAILLQQGRDEEAMGRIARFSELVSKYTRLNPDIETDELLEPLNELLSAFNNSDTVLIGDLLEYEIVPLIEKTLHGNADRQGE